MQGQTMQVNIKSVYGREHIYPVSKNAQIFCTMLDQNTLTLDNIKHIKLLGYEIEVVSDQPTTL